MPATESLYGPLFSTESINQIWSDENLVRTWLQTECAIAQALDEHDLLEPGALDEIRRVASLESVDLDALRKRTRAVGMPIKPLVEQITEAGGLLTQKYFHWGATTQDILDSSQALRLKASLTVIEDMMRSVLRQLVDIAVTYSETPMVARTNAQDASVTTWGLQVSSFAAEVIRHLERVAALRPRATTGMLGGAVGTLAALGSHGLAVRHRTLALLGLTQPVGVWNGSQDGVAEVIQCAALIQGTLVRLANNVEFMGRTGIGELSTVRPEGASSTMPHKTNPRDANAVQTCFQLGAMYASQAVHLMDQTDVRSAAKRAASWVTVPEALRVLGAALDRTSTLLNNIVVNEEKMSANFSHSRQFIMSEAVLFSLAMKIGRDKAYNLIQAALAGDNTDHPLPDILANDRNISAHLTDAEIREACNPVGYLGHASALVGEVVAQARPWLTISAK